MTAVLPSPPPAAATDVAGLAARWEMTTARRVRLAAGEAFPDAGGSVWALVAEGAVTVETAARRCDLASGDAVHIDATTAFRLVATEASLVLVADLRLAVRAHPLPSPLVVTRFSDRHRGVTGS